MRRRLFLVLGFALTMGLVAGLMVYRAVIRATSARGEATDQVVVAVVNMEVGEAVTSEHVKLSRWPTTAVPEGAFRNLAEVEGRVARKSIVAGEPLIEAKLLGADAALGGLLPVLVPKGLRGVTIKVTDAVRESGFVQPNSRVDVLVSIAKGGSSRDRIAKVILQNVPVLAAGQIVEMQDNKPVQVTTVTLALTPEQAERLALAQSGGRLTLATRNLGDNRVVQTAGATRATLLGDAPSTPNPTKARLADSAPLPPPKFKTHRVAVFRAGKVTDYTFVRQARDVWVAADPR